MAEQDEFLTGSIDEYLLGLADGIQKAQRQLSQMAIEIQPGESAVTYQIPRVDFELKMSMEVTTSSDDGSALLRFRPANMRRGASQSTSTEATSIIKGAFVAVPVHGGKPPPVIRTRLNRITNRRFEVTVLVASAAGERLAGVDVQLNIDRDRSRQLRLLSGATFPTGAFDQAGFDGASFDTPGDLRPGTRFWDGVVTTDVKGEATGLLDIDANEPLGTPVVAVVDVLARTETILFVVE